MTRCHPPNISILKKRVFVWCSVLWVWDRSSVGGSVCLFSASTSLWCCEAADQGRYLHIFLSQLKTRCLFLLSSVGGSGGSVPHYSSVKCCLWILDGHWVLTDKVRKELSESCHSAIQVSEGCCYIPPKPPLLQPGQVKSAFPDKGTCFNLWDCLAGLLLNMFQLCVSSLSSGNLVKISTARSVLLCAVRWVGCKNLSSDGHHLSKATPVLYT